MSGGRASRDKGNRFERQCVSILQEAGLGAQRIPLSGSAGGMFGSDISVPVRNIDRKIEAKKRAGSFGSFYRWLEGNYALFIARDRSEPLVVMRLSDFAELALIRQNVCMHEIALPEAREAA